MEDNRGNRARIDRRGDSEEILGAKPDPLWYAAYAPGWAHLVVTLTAARNVIYWDSSAAGGISLTHAGQGSQKLSYVFHGGQKDAAFAREDRERLVHPLEVRFGGARAGAAPAERPR